MPDTPTLRCQRCGQGFQISVTDTYNLMPARFCPICGGTARIQRSSERVTFASKLGGKYYVEKCAAFDVLDPQLLVLLYQDWRILVSKGTPNVEQRFIDYVKQQVEHGD